MPLIGTPSSAIMRSPASHPRERGRTARHEFQDMHRRVARQTEMPHHARRNRHRRAGHADIGTAHPAMGEQLADDPFCRIDSGGKANRLGLRDHRRVDADDPSLGVDQRAAGIARIERRIGLNDIVHQPAGCCAQGAPQRRDDARGHGLRIAERIADGDGDLSHLQARRNRRIPRRAARSGDPMRSTARSESGSSADEIGVEARVVIQAHA